MYTQLLSQIGHTAVEGECRQHSGMCLCKGTSSLIHQRMPHLSPAAHKRNGSHPIRHTDLAYGARPVGAQALGIEGWVGFGASENCRQGGRATEATMIGPMQNQRHAVTEDLLGAECRPTPTSLQMSPRPKNHASRTMYEQGAEAWPGKNSLDLPSFDPTSFNATEGPLLLALMGRRPSRPPRLLRLLRPPTLLVTTWRTRCIQKAPLKKRAAMTTTRANGGGHEAPASDESGPKTQTQATLRRSERRPASLRQADGERRIAHCCEPLGAA